MKSSRVRAAAAVVACLASAPAAAVDTPALRDLLAEARWAAVPELSSVFRAGTIVEVQPDGAHTVWAAAGECFSSEATSNAYASQSFNTALAGGVRWMSVARAEVSTESVMQFGEPTHWTLPKGAAVKTDCLTRLGMEGDREKHRGNFYVITESLESKITESRAVAGSASVGVGPVGGSASGSREAGVRADVPVVVGVRTTSVDEITSRISTDQDALACQGGDQPACTRLGVAYLTGVGLGYDPAKAFDKLRPACEAGHTEACYGLGYLYSTGQGVMRDVERGGELYAKACDGGIERACMHAGYAAMDAGVAETAFKYFKHACDGRVHEACYEAGRHWLNGWGVEASPRKAEDAATYACDGGVAPACVMQAQFLFMRPTPEDVMFGVDLLGRACFEYHDRGSCQEAARLMDAGMGNLVPNKKFAKFYERASWQ